MMQWIGPGEQKKLGAFTPENMPGIREKMNKMYDGDTDFKKWEDQCEFKEINIEGGAGQ